VGRVGPAPPPPTPQTPIPNPQSPSDKLIEKYYNIKILILFLLFNKK